MEKPSEMTDTSLELLGLREIKHSLRKTVSISIGYHLDSSRRLFWSLKIVYSNVFGNLLIGTTIQDGNKRERSTIVTFYHTSLAKSVKLK